MLRSYITDADYIVRLYLTTRMSPPPAPRHYALVYHVSDESYFSYAAVVSGETLDWVTAGRVSPTSCFTPVVEMPPTIGTCSAQSLS